MIELADLPVQDGFSLIEGFAAAAFRCPLAAL
jgi:hypothetical protein